MTTISEFIEGPELDKILVHNCDKYRKSFIRIVEKSGVGDADVEEFLKDSWLKPSPSAKKIMGFLLPKFRSWNWAGFFFNVYWAIYRKQGIGWFFLVFSLLCFLPEHWDPGLSKFSAIPFICAIVLGGKGDSFILLSALRTYAKKTPLDGRKARSIIRPIIAIILTFVYFVVYAILLNKGIIPPLQQGSAEEFNRALNSSELKILFSDTTVKWTNQKGIKVTLTTNSDGSAKVFAVSPKQEIRRKGKWWIKEPNIHCVKWDNRKRNICRPIGIIEKSERGLSTNVRGITWTITKASK